MMANGARGETTLVIDGEERPLCLTLSALAQMETAFGAESIEALAARFSSLSAHDLIIVIAALAGIGADEVMRARIDFADAALAVGEAFERALA